MKNLVYKYSLQIKQNYNINIHSIIIKFKYIKNYYVNYFK